MATVFAKRFWGFDPQGWPIISFNNDGNRDNLIRHSRPGNFVLFVGTLGKETKEEERGRLIGIAQFGRNAIDSLSAIDPTCIDDSCYENGEFKWPKAVPMVRAWRFTPMPIVTDVFEKQLPAHATYQAIAISERDAAAVMALLKEEVPVRSNDKIDQLRILNDALAGRPTTGPAPSSWSDEVERNMEGPAVTYAFRFGTSNIYKIGHAQDKMGRLGDVNKHIPFELLEEQWIPVLEHNWANSLEAYGMEQRVLKKLTKQRTHGERVKCSFEELQSAWIAVVANKIL